MLVCDNHKMIITSPSELFDVSPSSNR